MWLLVYESLCVVICCVRSGGGNCSGGLLDIKEFRGDKWRYFLRVQCTKTREILYKKRVN